MITSKVLDGFTMLDGCIKCYNSDSTIDCYVLNRDKISKSFNSDKELCTNGIYILIGEQDNKIMSYIGKASIGSDKTSIIRRLMQHMDALNEPYYSYWTKALVFTCRNKDAELQWTTATIDDLEALLIRDTRSEFRWNNKNESLRNPISFDHARSHSRKLYDIKEYIKYLGLKIFDEVGVETNKYEVTDEDAEAALVKQLIDSTISLETKNISDKGSRIPEYTTPEQIVDNILNLLPWHEFNHETRFLDPACKGGEFLALVHDRLMKVLNNDAFFDSYTGDSKTLRIHDYIVNNMIYGIAIGDNSFKTSRERVYNCKNIIRANDEYIKILKADLKGAVKAFAKAFIGDENMRFDVVIGNPPYQSEKNSIYQLFMELGSDISNTVCLITRNNWFNGKAFKHTREHMMSEGGFSIIKDYPIIGDVFSNVQVAVASFLWKRGYNGSTKYIRIENNKEILTQDLNIDKFIIYKSDIAKSIIDKTTTNSNWTDIYNTRSYPFMDQRKRYSLDRSKVKTEEYNVGILANGEDTKYTKLEFFTNTSEVKSYNVICGVIINEAFENRKGNALTNIQLLEPYMVSSESFSLIASFNTKEEAERCKTYIKTQFVRFMCNQTVNNRSNVTDNTFQFVPLQDFTSTSDIDWSQPLQNIDQQLYKKYNLSDEEINYIEKTIKPMDESSPTSKLKLTAEDVKAAYINQLINNQ